MGLGGKTYRVTAPVLRVVPISRRVLHNLRDHLNGHTHEDFEGYDIHDWPGPGYLRLGLIEPASPASNVYRVTERSELVRIASKREPGRSVASFGGSLVISDERQLMYILAPFMDALDTATLPPQLTQPRMVEI